VKNARRMRQFEAGSAQEKYQKTFGKIWKKQAEKMEKHPNFQIDIWCIECANCLKKPQKTPRKVAKKVAQKCASNPCVIRVCGLGEVAKKVA
jgi:deoxyadenosine/deoxycytidine kinase